MRFLIQKLRLVEVPQGTLLCRATLAASDDREIAQRIARQECGRVFDTQENQVWTAQSGCWLPNDHDLDGQVIPREVSA